MSGFRTAGAAIAAGLLGSAVASASVSIGWTSPADGSTAPVGSVVAPIGEATAGGATGGTGLDLVLVLDSSGSMSFSETAQGITQSRQLWQQQIATAIVQNLPAGSTSVGVVEFDSDANTVRTLSPLSSEINEVLAAINSVDAFGGTDIGDGITEATGLLTGPGATPGRSQQMLVISDGQSSQSLAVNAATNAQSNGLLVNTVALPGADAALLSNVAVAGGGFFADATPPGGLDGLLDLFDGTAGTPIGIDSVTVTTPDGATTPVTVDPFLGAFTSPAVVIGPGPNEFIANVLGSDGSTDTATLIINGVSPEGPATIPEPGAVLVWSVIGFGVAIVCRKRASAA